MSSFDQESIEGVLPGWHVMYHASLDSTNAEAKRRVERGLSCAGDLIIANEQHTGVGRKGAWISPADKNIYATFIVQPEMDAAFIGCIGITAGLALCDVLSSHGLKPQLKWPNDVYLEGKKCAGILVEFISGYALIGIGINMYQQAWSAEIAEVATCVASHVGGVTRSQVLGAVVRNTMGHLSRLGTSGYCVQEAFGHYDCLAGEIIELVEPSKDGVKLTGVANGVNDRGLLRLIHQDGAEVLVANAHHVRIVG